MADQEEGIQAPPPPVPSAGPAVPQAPQQPAVPQVPQQPAVPQAPKQPAPQMVHLNWSNLSQNSQGNLMKMQKCIFRLY